MQIASRVWPRVLFEACLHARLVVYMYVCTHTHTHVSREQCTHYIYVCKSWITQSLPRGLVGAVLYSVFHGAAPPLPAPHSQSTLSHMFGLPLHSTQRSIRNYHAAYTFENASHAKHKRDLACRWTHSCPCLQTCMHCASQTPQCVVSAKTLVRKHTMRQHIQILRSICRASWVLIRALKQ